MVTTKIGRTSTKCFDFLGFSISMDGLRVAEKSLQKLAECVLVKLADNKEVSSETCLKTASVAYGRRCLGTNLTTGGLSGPDHISRYVRRWLAWVRSIYGKDEFKILETFVT